MMQSLEETDKNYAALCFPKNSVIRSIYFTCGFWLILWDGWMSANGMIEKGYLGMQGKVEEFFVITN